MKRFAAALLCLSFAVVFGGLGAVGAWAVGSIAWEGWRSAEWVRVRAQVASFDGRQVAYRYALGGAEHAGHRIVARPLQEAGLVPEELADRLRAAARTRAPITVYVDPDDPAQAVVEREVPWSEVVVATPLVLVLALMGFGGLRAFARTVAGRSPWATALPRQPEGQMGLGAFWFFTAVWNVMSFGMAALMVADMTADEEWLGLAVMMLFPLIGLALLWSAIRLSIQRLYPGPVERAGFGRHPRARGHGRDIPEETAKEIP